MRLIDADVLIAEICQDQCERKYCDCDYTCSVVAPIVNAPTIPAVLLDKLCEWLAENAEFPMEVEVKIFYEPTEEPEIKLNRMPNDAERWREKLTKWMEGQHET